MSSNWKGWSSREDLPPDLRAVIRQGELVPMLDPREAATMQRTVLETFAEVVDTFLEEAQLRWTIDHLHRSRPNMPMEAVFMAISLEDSVSVPRLRTIWYTDRRKARLKEILREKLKGAQA
jgi:hypothetical protein